MNLAEDSPNWEKNPRGHPENYDFFFLLDDDAYASPLAP